MRRLALFCVLIAAAVPCAALAADSDDSPATARDLSVDQSPYVDIVPHESGHLRVDATLDHRSGVYRIGDKLQLSVRTNEDAYITVLDIGTSGRATILFPNRRARDNHVEGGETLDIPNSGRWSIGVNGPTGVEMIKVFASKSPRPIFHGHASEGDVYSSIDEAPRDAVRDLDVVLNSEHRRQWAETRLYFRVRHGHGGDEDDSEDHHHHADNNHSESDALNLLGNLPRRSAFDVDIQVDRDDATYEVGDSLGITVKTERDCNLKVIDIGSSGDATIVFPNRGQHRTHVEAGETIEIPSDRAHFAYRVAGPRGKDELIAVCRTGDDAFLQDSGDWSANMYEPYRGGRSSVERDLEVVLSHDDERGHTGYNSAIFRVRD